MLTVVTKSSLTAGVRWAALEGDGTAPLPGGAVAAAQPEAGGEEIFCRNCLVMVMVMVMADGPLLLQGSRDLTPVAGTGQP